MEINTTTNHLTQFLAKTDAVKNALSQDPLTVKDSGEKVTELERAASVQAVNLPENLPEQKSEKEDLNDIAKELTEMVAMMQKGLKFSVDDDSGKRVIKVQDIESGDIIRQIPSEEALKLAEKLSEVSGILMKIEV
jgi:flagellar protein FlaG